MPTMSSHIIIERLEFRSRCGVTAEERAKPQPLAVDLELDAPLDPAGHSDNLADTIDYAKIAQRLVEIGTTQEACLLETMAERFLAMLLSHTNHMPSLGTSSGRRINGVVNKFRALPLAGAREMCETFDGLA